MHTPSADTRGMYVLASVVADPRACEATRAKLMSLVAKGRHRLHWRDESEPLRRKITAVIVACGFPSIVVVGTELDARKQERARRKCMRRLLFELDRVGVGQVWLESRTQSLNRKDGRLIDALRGEQAISKDLRIDFGLPSEEPMLWVPDAVAGACAAARKYAGGEEHRHALGGLLREFDIEL